MSEALSPETGYVDVEGGRLYYEVAGAGPALVLVHAGVADCRMWDEQVGAFARHYRVIRYDTRGFGKTTSGDVAFSDRQDLADLLSHLGIDRTAVLGLSRGGQIAVDFTLEHPEMVDALVAVAAGISGYQGPATEAELQLFHEYGALSESKDAEGLIELGVRVWVDGPGQPVGRAAATVRDRVREMMASNDRSHREELQPRALEPPAVERLGEIRVPTLVVVGDLDFTGVVAAMALLGERVAGARHVVVPGTAHMVSMEQPERFNGMVLEFLGMP
ncbi:MAG TPA: alpha/beta fold hydrolase [Chloroflexota bacterium]|nr:alpha/beta fold hydrolase [Chloroflexota bacterium]